MKIVILFHEADRHPEATNYGIWDLRTAWAAAGHAVRLQQGLNQALTDDIVVLHTDLTVVPTAYRQALAACPRVVNRRLTDISKTLFSRLQVRSPDDGDGPVIVKTVLNHGGKPERRLRRRGPLERLRYTLVKRGLLPLAWAEDLNPDCYPIFPSARAVPAGVYRNPALLVERFVPERRGDLYCLRSYTFLGDRWVNEVYGSREPIVKRSRSVLLETGPVPDAIREVRQTLGADYGKFDYVMHAGEPVLLDVNRTPAIGWPPELRQAHGRHLAAGLAAAAF